MQTPQRLTERLRPAIVAHFLALSPEDRYLRFGTALAPQVIAAYVERIDFERDAVFGIRDENLALAGVAHVASGEQGMEVGLSVLPGHRRRGLGRALFRRAVAYARGRRMPQLFMHFLAGNAPIVRIAQRFGMNIVSRGVEVRAQLVLR